MAQPGAATAWRPGPLTRRLLRVPVVLYRWHLGRLLGRRFLLLTHRGRRTGRLYRTVVEVIGHDAATGEVLVLALHRDACGPAASRRAAAVLAFRPDAGS